ncbi:iron ABC transporter permease [Photobacterium swingsii]|uniref:Iron ABC transporter permease n=1 Tax=Photobacterium swingsii TaxID=680026 RepID=A0A0J8V7P5_9GAMM|nr:iron ABC transporter permease [Photobacterium swingsii]KMV28675.1 hypothetical protein AB733_22190 [Photobacterium swingsii]PSW26131.1 iron ABC transporter permease [Photobacterium swingsii]
MTLQYCFLAMFLVVSAFICALLGAVPTKANDIVFAVTGLLSSEPLSGIALIVAELRFPRLILAMLTGGGLAICGLVLQKLTRNPLADPFLFGLSAGASSGAVACIVLNITVIGVFSLPAFAFCGAMLAQCMLHTLTRQNQWHPERVVLAGLIVNSLFSAITGFLIFSGDQRTAQSVLFWLMGGLGLAKWSVIPIITLVVVICYSFIHSQQRNIDRLTTGDELAASMGVNVEQTRKGMFLVVGLLTATLVAWTGTIGFVGLIIPNVVNRLGIYRIQHQLPICFLCGAIFLVWADAGARVLLQPQELPISMITSAVGAFVCLILIVRRKL